MSKKFDLSEHNLPQWAEQVRLFELGKALQNLAQGQNPTLIAEVMSVKIMNKILHPVLKSISNNE